MSKRIQLFIVMMLFIVAVTGCISKEPSIVGTWYSEQDSMEMIINKDGTFYLTDKTLEHGDLLSGTYRIEGEQFFYTPTNEVEMANTFTLSKDTLTLKYKEFSSTFKRVEK